jgi:predicted kinase
MSTLSILAGLPGAGKSTPAQLLGDLCGLQVEAEGYRLAYRIAADNLQLGIDVIADSCNPIEPTRDEWEQVAENDQVRHTDIEVICSDGLEHRQRIESRDSPVSGLKLPTWRDVENREYHPWQKEWIIIDAVGRSKAECFEELMKSLETIDSI